MVNVDFCLQAEGSVVVGFCLFEGQMTFKAWSEGLVFLDNVELQIQSLINEVTVLTVSQWKWTNKRLTASRLKDEQVTKTVFDICYSLLNLS